MIIFVCLGFFCKVPADAGHNCVDVPNTLNGVFSYGDDCAGLGTFGMAIDAAIDIARRDGCCSADTQSVQQLFSEDHPRLFDWLLSHAPPTVQRERDVTRRTWVPKFLFLCPRIRELTESIANRMAGKLNTLVEPNLDGVGANSVGAVQTPDAIVNESGREGVLRDNREHSQPTRPECSREHGSQRLWLRTRSGGRDLVEELSRCGVNSATSFDPCCEKPQARTVREFWVRPGLRFAAALQGHADSGLCVREGATPWWHPLRRGYHVPLAAPMLPTLLHDRRRGQRRCRHLVATPARGHGLRPRYVRSPKART